MSGEHSILSPSSAHRRVRCVGSLAACKDVPNVATRYAAEGTVYHEIAAQVLTALDAGVPDDAPYSCDYYVGQTLSADGFEFVITEENAEHAQRYVDAIRRIPGVRMYEVRLDTSAVVGVVGQGGTGDCVTLDYENDTIHVDDLKFGYRVVTAKDNEQLIEYGAAALYKFELLHPWKFVKVAIHQPRGAVKYDEHVYTVEELRAAMARIAPFEQAAYKLWQNTPSDLAQFLTPSEKGCEWCPIKGTCAKRSRQMLDEFPLSEPGKPAAPAAITMTDAEIGAARDRVDAIEAWCADIKAQARARALAGHQIPGWKLVRGRKGDRKWEGELAQSNLELNLGDEAFKPREIISPADAEKKFKKAKLDFSIMAPFITQADGALSLERDASPKDAVSVSMPEFPLQEPT